MLIFLLASTFFIYIVVAADRAALPDFIVVLYHFPYGDKIGHLLLMGIWTWIIQACVIAWHKNNGHDARKITVVAWVVAGFVTIEELTQIFIPNRNFSISDLVCSYLGILIFSSVYRFILKNQINKKTKC